MASGVRFATPFPIEGEQERLGEPRLAPCSQKERTVDRVLAPYSPDLDPVCFSQSLLTSSFTTSPCLLYAYTDVVPSMASLSKSPEFLRSAVTLAPTASALGARMQTASRP